MHVSELSLILKQMQDCYDTAGAKAQANDFERMIEILGGHESETVEDFVCNLRPKLEKKSPRKQTPQAQPDQTTVNRYVTLLNGAETNQEAFGKAFEKLKCDSKIRKREIDAIANAYVGGSNRYKSKKVALESIKKKFVQQVRFEGKMNIVDKLTPW